MISHRRILMVHTGGTIGMRLRASGLTLGSEFINDLEKWLAKERFLSSSNISLECLEPLIDSADATPSHWSAIARLLWERRSSYDSAVVLHGTDTLSYSASALSFLLCGIGKSIVFTGSQIPFLQVGSDARANLRGALRCAFSRDLQEVCVFFDGRLLRGNRTHKASTSVGKSFVSPHWPTLARTKPAFRLNKAAFLHRRQKACPPAQLGNASIGLIKIYPGISEAVISAALDAHPSGIVLELYGSGTGPLKDRSLVRAFRRARSQRTPLFAVSQCQDGVISEPSYESSQRYRELGVVSGFDLTTEAALTKLHYLHALGEPDMRGAMLNPIAGEISSGDFCE
jgi:L-asparaginase